MIVFDLQCAANRHVFEAWFATSEAFDDQAARGMIACPICGDTAVTKALMAPHVGVKGNRTGDTPSVPLATSPGGEGPSPEQAKALLARIADMQARALEKSNWVGADFAEQARAMHLGERDSRPIHGQASHSEAEALIDEGIAVMPLLFPVMPPESRN